MEDSNVFILDKYGISPLFDKILRVVEKNQICSFGEKVLSPIGIHSFKRKPIDIWISDLNVKPKFSMIEIVDEPRYSVFAHFIPNEDYLDRIEWFADQLNCKVIYSDDQLELMTYD